MDSKNDKEYLIAVKTEYKLLEKKFLKTRDKLDKWEKRATLAEEKGKFNLLSEAEAQAEIVRNDIKYMTDQLVGLKVEVEKAVDTTRKSPQKQLSIDPNNLLEEMNALIGDGQSSEFDEELKIIQVDNELEELKKKMES
jgi:phage shock protein A